MRCAKRAGHNGACRPTHCGPGRRCANRPETGGFTSAGRAVHDAFSLSGSCTRGKAGQLAGGRAKRRASSARGGREAGGWSRFG